MAQRIVTECDMHAARGEAVSGEPYDVAYREAGGRFTFLTIDLCEDCAKPLAELFTEIETIGREFVGDVPIAKKTAARKTAATPAPPTAATEAVCPVCQNPFSDRKHLMAHVRSVHRKALADLEGTAKFTCPVCGDGFSTPQGSGTHLRRSHPKEAAQRKRDATVADG